MKTRRKYNIGILFIWLQGLFLPLLAGAQKEALSIPIPMRNGRVFYESSFSLGEKAWKQDLYRMALKWFDSNFPEDKIRENEKGTEKGRRAASRKTGCITRREIFKVLTGDPSVNYYFISVTMHLIPRDSGYTLQIYDFYEKPVQKGITNDYSKIEYRWWDFRQGHPWFDTDKALFTGLNRQTMAYLESFKSSFSSFVTIPQKTHIKKVMANAQ